MPNLIEQIDSCIELERNSNEGFREHLGMSGIGHPCSRKIWFSFRWCDSSSFKASTLYNFEDGNRCEKIISDRIKSVKEVRLDTEDLKTGKQFNFKFFGGHFAGSLDGAMVGLDSDVFPKVWHVWECKSVNESSFNTIKKLVDEDEKTALNNFSFTYYAQAVCYMKAAGLKNHYTVFCGPGGRGMLGVFTEENPFLANTLFDKAEKIITSKKIPERVAESKSFYMCKMCEFTSICHDAKIANVNCRTCVNSKPVTEGSEAQWFCRIHNKILSKRDQISACDSHVYLPDLVKHSDVVDFSAEENWIAYKSKKTGEVWTNGDGKNKYAEKAHSSLEIKNAEENSLTCKEVNDLRAFFDAKIVK